MISVIVPVLNAGRYLERTIGALQGQDYPPAQFELILVDNGSDDASLRMLQRHPGIRVFSESERGSYAARNSAIRVARGDILAFTDADCCPARGWLAAIDRGFAGGPAEVLLGPRLPARNRGWLGLVSAYENTKAEMVCGWNDPLVFYGYTNNMAVRRATMDRFGPFVHRARGSDTIFVRRVVDALSCEAVAYCSDMLVEHSELDSMGVYYRKIMTYARSPRAYRNVIATRPLTQRERLRVWRRTIRGMRLLDAGQLAVLLAVGAIAWWAGGLNVPESEG